MKTAAAAARKPATCQPSRVDSLIATPPVEKSAAPSRICTLASIDECIESGTRQRRPGRAAAVG